MSYKAPKSIVCHEGVETCEYGPTSGVEDYKHDVVLKSGWEFRNGRMKECQLGHFNTAKEFEQAQPRLKLVFFYIHDPADTLTWWCSNTEEAVGVVSEFGADGWRIQK